MFKNITNPSRENLAEMQTVFHRKYVKPLSRATAKQKFQQLVFNPANQKLIDFFDQLQKLVEDAFEVGAEALFEQIIYAKMPPHLKKSINQAHSENGTCEQIVSHLERELELNVLEAPDGMQINTVKQQSSKPNPERPKPTIHHCKKRGHYRNQCRQLKKERDQNDTNKNAGKNSNSNINSGKTSSKTHNNETVNNGSAKVANNRKYRKSRIKSENPTLWDLWQNEALHRQMLFWR